MGFSKKSPFGREKAPRVDSQSRRSTQSKPNMVAPHPSKNEDTASETKLRIFILPNLLTAGNLFCGFLALTNIVQADPARDDFNSIILKALLLILLACLFDLFDGRVARMGGVESPFGREFDSLADIVSFGVAPAFLVHRIVLKDVFVQHEEFGWFIASVYLICGALRLARFNVMAAEPSSESSKEFMGFPIPAAAGLVASLTLFLMWWEDKGFSTGQWRYILPVLLIFLSMMMISEVKYPSFKGIGFRTRGRFTTIVGAILFIGLIFIMWNKILPIILPIIFTAYLVYGFIRLRLPRNRLREIEEEEDLEL
ncbi:MAG: CDP-diacylglycerol--serine O-phosphatidyltransferase [Verrucomicrobia bacterium]|jgi:CDP-diacylglycerol--serine O-phosphatidyltransferase|nr:CDP-diacylglycerol--serine O-phosphatidyltransferase [Verrucomicrobiota bacterium]